MNTQPTLETNPPKIASREDMAQAQHWPLTQCARTFLHTPGVRDIPAKSPGHPRSLSSKPKEDKLSRESTNFSATTLRMEDPHPTGRPPDPKSYSFCSFFLPVCMVVGLLLTSSCTSFIDRVAPSTSQQCPNDRQMIPQMNVGGGVSQNDGVGEGGLMLCLAQLPLNLRETTQKKYAIARRFWAGW